jgi:two-component system, cell cycle sensor histidine kinase and response regulator CckA
MGSRKDWQRRLSRVAIPLLSGQVLLCGAEAPGDTREPSATAPLVGAAEGLPWHGPGFMTNLRDVSLALTSVLLLTALGWSVSLRRRVKEQTVRIRWQIRRETELEVKYRDLFENANDMVFGLDLTGRITSLNKAGERLLGCARERAARATLHEFVAPAHLDAYQEWMKKCLLGALLPRLELEIVALDGTRSILELSARVLRDGDQVVGVEGVARDISERRRAEAALRASEERFSSAFRVSPVAIGISRLADGRYVDVNDSFLRLFGYSREEVLQRTAADLNLWDNPAAGTRMEGLFHQNRSVGGTECTFRVHSGQVRTGLVFAERIDVGNDPCSLILVHDMTDRLKLEDQLRQASKMEAVGRLAAGVAHDFNNLLMIIRGNADLALAHNSNNADVARALDQVSQAAQRAANLTGQLLAFSRKQNLQPKPVDVNEVINNATKMFKHLLREDIQLRFKFTANLPIVKADPTMLEQVIMNLVVNARDAMPRGGEITLGTAQVRIDETDRHSHSEAAVGAYVCFSVTDTGCGMDAATQARIFEPFFTTKDIGKGTGLGLATVYGIVKQHQGWIDLASEVGKGSTFKVFLPVDAAGEAMSRGQVSAPTIEGSPTILVVEDESALIELVRRALEQEEYRVLEAADGLSALQVWNDNHGEIDLLLTDIRMPHGMSGIDLAGNLRALKPTLKVVYSSGYSPEALDAQSMHEAVFLAKPYSIAKLLQTVRTMLESPSRLAAA